MKDEDIDGSAILSPDRLYRYELRRRWGAGKTCCFVGLNPSTADERKNDMTVRKCIGFADRWGYRSICVLNLFAFRATSPTDMEEAADPIGPLNDEILTNSLPTMGRVVVAWGANDFASERAAIVTSMIPRPLCLGLTKEGHPRHPSRIAYATELIPYEKTR